MAAVKANLILLAVLGVISSVISAFYYLRIIKIMYCDENENLNIQLSISPQSILTLTLCMFFICFFIFYPTFLTLIAQNIANQYFSG